MLGSGGDAEGLLSPLVALDGEPAPEEVARVDVGSHPASHRHLTGLPLHDVAREAARSRAAIVRNLGIEPSAIAYPYGDVDPAVRRIVGAAGYAYGVTVERGRAALTGDPLALPRIEVTPDTTVEALRRAVGLPQEGPSATP